MRAYASFYNPINTLRAMLKLRRNPVTHKRLMFQFIGQIGLMLTLPKLAAWTRRLRHGPIVKFEGFQPARIPMRDAASGKSMDWAIETKPPEPSRIAPPRADRSRKAGTSVNGRTMPLPILQPA